MKHFFAIAFLLLFSGSAWACDICNLYEFRPVDAKNFVGVFYRRSSFHDYRGLTFSTPSYTASKQSSISPRNLRHVPDESATYQVWQSDQDYEHYQTWEIRANFRIANRINLQAVIPIRRIDVYYHSVFAFPEPVKDSLTTITGLGDALLTADYMLYGQTGRVRHIWRPGLGVKLPSGTYKKAASNGERYDAEIQPGTSAWGLLLKGTYTLVLDNKAGLDVSASHQFFTEGRNKYRFGDQFNAATSLFYVLKKGNWQVIPRAGAYVEAAAQSEENGTKLSQTGGHSLFATAGADVVVKNITVTASFFQPLADHLNTPQQINNAQRFQIGAFYSF